MLRDGAQLITVLMELVEADFILNPQQYEDAAGQTDRQSGYVYG
jgi:hypothetical protein